MNSLKPLFYIGLFTVCFFFYSCDFDGGSTLKHQAVLLEFTIDELPNTDFSVHTDLGLVEVANRETLPNRTDSLLTARFKVSEGANVFVRETPQISGHTKNDFRDGLFVTVVSEDFENENTYLINLNRDIPLKYIISDEIRIRVNPYNRNPLGAILNFRTKEDANVSYTVLGDHPIHRDSYGSGSLHAVSVIGLYPNTLNKVVLNISSDENNVTARDTITIVTEPLPDFLPEPEINVLRESEMEPGMHFNEFSIGNAGSYNSYPFIFDNNGVIRWVTDLTGAGQLAWAFKFDETFSYYFTYGSTIYEYTMLGGEINTIPLNDIYSTHHEVLKLPNGNFIVAVSKSGARMIKNGEERNSVEDFIIEVSPPYGEVITEWDMAEILDVNRTNLTDAGHDWFHMNAIWYDEEDEALVISGRNQGVVKVNWENELQWILAPHQGWGKAGRYEKTTETASFLLTAVDQNETPFPESIQDGAVEHSNFSWTWGQHAPMYLPNGNLFIFDNGFNRNFGLGGNYSMGTEYEIDEDKMTVKQVWSYGKDRGSAFFSNIISDVDHLPETRNRLIMPGVINYGGNSYSKITEVKPSNGEVVFESTLHFKNQKVNGTGWGNLDITYRGGRIDLNRTIFSDKR